MSAEPVSMDNSNHIRALLAQTIQDNKIEIPMLPEVAGKVVQLTQDPESDATKLASLIQGDQSLAAHVMRVANSAAYSPNSTMVSMQQAIARLGMQLISEIALAASINSEMFDAPGFEKHINYELKYSLFSGLWAKEVARACRKNVEAAFLAGLLHDIGKPIAIQSVIKLATQHGIAINNEEVLKIENEFHRAIGIKVVEQWEMPKAVIDVVTYFDEYTQPHDAQTQTMSVVAGANIASHFMCEEGDDTCLTRDEIISLPALADLNLYQDDVLDILEKEEKVTQAMEAMSS